jgi:hypothetical protein
MVWLFFCSQVVWSGPLSPGLRVNRVVPPETTLVQEGPDFVEVQTLDGGRGWIEAKVAK